MHPNIKDAMALLRDIFKDPGNVPKVIDRTNRAFQLLANYEYQGVPEVPTITNDAPAVEPEPKPKKTAKK